MIHIIWITDIIYYINCLVFDKRIQGVITDLHIMYCRSKFELSHTECWNICCVPFAARCSVRLPADFNSTLRKGKCFHTICIHSFSVWFACIAASHAMPWRFSRPYHFCLDVSSFCWTSVLLSLHEILGSPWWFQAVKNALMIHRVAEDLTLTLYSSLLIGKNIGNIQNTCLPYSISVI